ncbi:type IV toxin-antitoxin system AbiEi family antitoxin domain-containing protein [Streptomyces sp. 4N509B]|uniref:type IV toxin-antitoxin system AbiEi family antitoxin domain-containing protein n=1 Tax=Streptomyces sp. 4N509B TaxID=3457413 RepID=UPI003FD2ABD8
MDSDALPATFRYVDAHDLGLSDRRLRHLLAEGTVERFSRGLYRRADADPMVDLDLLEVAQRAPDGTLCLASALAHHGLTDQIPATIDIAIPRGRRTPQSRAPISWHHFARETFTVGREVLRVGPGEHVGVYSAERSIVDAFRLRHQEGPELAAAALRAWLRRSGNHPADLLAVARYFPRAGKPLRHALEILL